MEECVVLNLVRQSNFNLICCSLIQIGLTEAGSLLIPLWLSTLLYITINFLTELNLILGNLYLKCYHDRRVVIVPSASIAL